MAEPRTVTAYIDYKSPYAYLGEGSAPMNSSATFRFASIGCPTS